MIDSQKVQYTLLVCIYMGAFLLTGSESLECHSCTKSDCSDQTVVECAKPMNICTEIIVLLRTGNQSLPVRHKGCASGLSSIISYHVTFDGLTIRHFEFGCDTSLCNAGNTPFSTLPTEPPVVDPPENATECHTCVDTDESRCLGENAQKIICPAGQDRCYRGNGSLLIGNVLQPIFIQKCSSPGCPSFNYHASKWYNLSLSGSCCSGDYCNKILAPVVTLPTNDVGSKFTTKNGATPSATSISLLVIIFAVFAIGKF
uniref:UPAR/Ly6 domain-containing protein n=1 Tax=Leptobrachium leishanense TaxID=445787 RepID=A0A8C5R8V1_9ANUR